MAKSRIWERRGHELIVKLIGVPELSSEDRAKALEVLQMLGHGEQMLPCVLSEALWLISEGRLYGSRLFLFMCLAFSKKSKFRHCLDPF